MGLYTSVGNTCNYSWSSSSTIPHNIKNNKQSMLLKLEHGLSPYVAFGIMPVFAFANAGVSLGFLLHAS